MLEKILAISGKPGLYKLISGSKKMVVVESLIDGKRTPAYTTLPTELFHFQISLCTLKKLKYL